MNQRFRVLPLVLAAACFAYTGCSNVRKADAPAAVNPSPAASSQTDARSDAPESAPQDAPTEPAQSAAAENGSAQGPSGEASAAPGNGQAGLSEAESQQLYDRYIASVGASIGYLPFSRGNVPGAGFQFWTAYEVISGGGEAPFPGEYSEGGVRYVPQQEVEETLLDWFDLGAEDIRAFSRNYDRERQAYRVPEGLGGYTPAPRVTGYREGSGGLVELDLAFYAGPDDEAETASILTIRVDADTGKFRYLSCEILDAAGESPSGGLGEYMFLVFDKDGPGDMGYRFELSQEQRAELAALLQQEQWRPAAGLPEMGVSAVLHVIDKSAERCLAVSPWDEESALVLVGTGEAGLEAYFAPAQVAEQAKAFARPFREIAKKDAA